MTRVTIKPELLNWACERAGLKLLDLQTRFPKILDWESGKVHPTLKQVEKFARAVHVPVGYLFLGSPPEEILPIPDFRTLGGKALKQPSPNLLDMIYACQERQSWFRDFARVYQQPKLKFIDSVTTDTSPTDVAKNMRSTLGFNVEERRNCKTWEEALRMFIQQADSAGVLVMTSGIVLNNTHRKLDIEEFRGFALVDKLAPIVFINGADTKSAQMFTLAHELAHLWLGASAISNISAADSAGFRKEEIWCNKVAAEFLVPLSEIMTKLHENEPLDDSLFRLSKTFKVSTLVILRRLLDAKWISRTDFDLAWKDENERLQEIMNNRSGGGNFYRITPSRVSRRFTKALVMSTLEGHTLYRDAFRMLGVSKTKTFNNIGRKVGIMA